MLLAGLFAICVFSVNMRASLQLPPPWHRALERRLESLERNFAEEKNKLWMEIYSMSSKRVEDVSEMSNSSVELKESQVVTDEESSNTEQKMEKYSGGVDAFLKGLRDEKKYVRDFINKAEQQRKRTQEDLHEKIESMDKRMSEHSIRVNNYVENQLAEYNTLHAREMTENLETLNIQLKKEVSGLKEDISNFQPICGTWNAFKGSCYLVANKLLTWEDARESCRVSGAYLAEVASKEEAVFLINLAKSAGSVGYGPWLGASDTKSEGDWVWQFSGRSVSEGFSDWSSVRDQPNGGTHENCLHMFNQVEFLYHWNDAPCTTKTNFICEK